MQRWVRRLLAVALVSVAAAVAVSQGTGPVAASEHHAVARLAAVTTTAVTAPVTMEKGHDRHHACRRGLVALTFDDGPRVGTTLRLLRTLRRLDVPATFFEIGQHVAQHPSLSRQVYAAGFAVENHSWSHPKLTHLSDAAVRQQVRTTTAALRAAGVKPGDLMRPPYGDVNPRVARDIRSFGLTPTLWNVDSGDWRGGSTQQIAASVLAQLRPAKVRPAGNVVLQHDGVTNSPASVAAVPAIVRTARHRGYCFAPLGRTGLPTPPVPHLLVSAVGGQEGGRPVALTLRLDQPTTVRTSVHLHSVDGTAHAGEDYSPLDLTVSFAPGVTYAIVRVPVVDDAVTEAPETFTVQLSDAVGLLPTAPTVTADVADNDSPPAG